MSELGSQQDYWNSRAANWDSYDAPLLPGDQEIAFMRRHIVPGSAVLILGATPQLCSTASEVTDTVTAVDFAQDVIETLRCPGVEYICQEWSEFFADTSSRFDTILTDGGLLCLEFPDSWQQLADSIRSHLRPAGTFAARVYLSTDQPPKSSYQNPNLARFIVGLSNIDEHYMLQVQGHADYRNYDVRYALPPDAAVRAVFRDLALVDQLIPDYEEGEHFVSYAWQQVDGSATT